MRRLDLSCAPVVFKLMATLHSFLGSFSLHIFSFCSNTVLLSLACSGGSSTDLDSKMNNLINQSLIGFTMKS